MMEVKVTLIEMVDPQAVALREIADRRLTRDDVALTYAFCIRQGETDRISEVNKAIIERWSLNALRYIKTAAWELVGRDAVITKDAVDGASGT